MNEGHTQLATALLPAKPEEDRRILRLATEVEGLLKYAEARVIASDDDLKPTTDDLAVIAGVKKALTEAKNQYVRPIRAHLEDVTAAFARIMDPLEEADKITRRKLLAYRDAQARRQAEADAINRQKVELARREAQFSGTGEITIDTTPVEAPAPVQRVRTDMGSAGVMKVRTWELVDFKAVPDEYKVIDSARVTRIVKAGGSIPGIKVIETEVIRVTTTGGE